MAPKYLKSCSKSVVPIDIIASEILPKLPVTTLLRFKCLNKFFYNYISSKEFIELQLQHSSNSNSNHLLMVFSSKRANQRCLSLLDFNSPGSPARYLSLPQPFCDTNRLLKVVGSCNGLLCLTSFDFDIYNSVYYAMIVNPSTGDVIVNISLSIPPLNTTCGGFAYDDVNDDYKLVLVVYFGERQPCNILRYRKVMVYSMKSDSWRLIETTYIGDQLTHNDHIRAPNHRTNCALLNNCLMHWLVISASKKKSIVCFNAKDEQWAADVSSPDSDDFQHDFRRTFTLGVVNGCLCVSHLRYDVDKFDVWIMKEYRAQGSWTMLSFAFPKCGQSCPFLAYEYANMKEILVSESWPNNSGIGAANKYKNQKYTWYNLGNKAARKLQLTGNFDNHMFDNHMLCIGSLATGRGNCQSQNCKETKLSMKIDSQVKVLSHCICGGII